MKTSDCWLKVDVVSTINDTFKAIGMETPDVDGLKAWIKDHNEVWDLYAQGYTLGLNQCEQPGSKIKIMQFKPRNVVELSAFVAAIRPGFKSLVQGFCGREKHVYGIPAMDKMLKLEGATGVTGENSYLMYDEQILHLAQYAGIEPGDAVTLIKSIKKKKKDKVIKYQERFVPGFKKYLIESEGDNEEHAEQTAKDTWKVIQDSASYLFNASHSLAMAYDSLYGAMLKTIAPFEFYRTLLQLYTDKKKKDKVSLAIDEMYANKKISFQIGKLGEDNREWLIDKEKSIISQRLDSIKYISKEAAEALYQIGLNKPATFTECMSAMRDAGIKKNQIELLIKIQYFDCYGKTEKLTKIYQEYMDGVNKCWSNPKSKPQRMEKIIELEKSLEDTDIDIHTRLAAENDFTGMCFAKDPEAYGKYFVLSVETRFGCKCQLYNCVKGHMTPTIRLSKNVLDERPFKEGDMLILTRENQKQKKKFKFVDGRRIPTDEIEWWIDGYKVIPKPEEKKVKDNGKEED